MGLDTKEVIAYSSFIDINVLDYWIINKLIVLIQKKPSLVTNIGHLLHL